MRRLFSRWSVAGFTFVVVGLMRVMIAGLGSWPRGCRQGEGNARKMAVAFEEKSRQGRARHEAMPDPGGRRDTEGPLSGSEGVESAAQLAFLRVYGCQECQGYYCRRPVPEGEIFRTDRLPGQLMTTPRGISVGWWRFVRGALISSQVPRPWMTA